MSSNLTLSAIIEKIRANSLVFSIHRHSSAFALFLCFRQIFRIYGNRPSMKFHESRAEGVKLELFGGLGASKGTPAQAYFR